MRYWLSLLYIIGVAFVTGASIPNDTTEVLDTTLICTDSISLTTDTIIRLTEEDYQRVADELGIEVAIMKSVVEVEAGISHKGFVESGKPIINFDAPIFKRYLRKNGINHNKHSKKEAFKRPDIRKHGSYGNAQWARLESARQIDSISANKATFWGMFQIGGFNWKKCGCKSIDEFVKKMSESEPMQLELFAQFCISTNLVKFLQKKDWNNFAYRYNGPSYKSKGYHNKLRKAYKKHKK